MSSSSLYIFKNARYITKYAITGVNPYVTLADNLNISDANSGVIPAFINVGTITPLSIDQLDIVDGTNIVTTITTTNDSIISGIPVNPLEPIKFAAEAAITLPIFDSLYIDINAEAKNISTNVLPIPSSEWPK